jgi:hypothetical protein
MLPCRSVTRASPREEGEPLGRIAVGELEQGLGDDAADMLSRLIAASVSSSERRASSRPIAARLTSAGQDPHGRLAWPRWTLSLDRGATGGAGQPAPVFWRRGAVARGAA